MITMVLLAGLLLSNSYSIDCALFDNTVVVAPDVSDVSTMNGKDSLMEIRTMLIPGHRLGSDVSRTSITWLGERIPVNLVVFWSTKSGEECNGYYELSNIGSWTAGLSINVEDLMSGREWTINHIVENPSVDYRCGKKAISRVPFSVGWVDMNEIVGGAVEDHVYKISLSADDGYINRIQPKPANVKTMSSYVLVRRPVGEEERAMTHCIINDDMIEVPGKKCYTRKDPEVVRIIEKRLFKALEEYPGLLCAVRSLAATYVMNHRYKDAFWAYAFWFDKIRKERVNGIDDIIERMAAFWIYEGMTIESYYKGFTEWEEYKKRVLERK